MGKSRKGQDLELQGHLCRGEVQIFQPDIEIWREEGGDFCFLAFFFSLRGYRRALV